MDNDFKSDELVFHKNKPNVQEIIKLYDDTVCDLSDYFHACAESYNDKRNHWKGKSEDLRKHGPDSFPWPGASDMEAHLISKLLDVLIGMIMEAMKYADIKARPTETNDAARSSVVSGFLKWMTQSGYIKNFKKEIERSFNYLLEKGIAITYVGYNKKDFPVNQLITIDQIANASPDIAESIQNGKDEKSIIKMAMAAFEGIDEKDVKRAIRELRKNGVAEFPMIQRIIDAPTVKSPMPDGEFVFPPWVDDPQESPACFYICDYTVQELENKKRNEGWDAGFTDYVISHYKGTDIDDDFINDERNLEASLISNINQKESRVRLIHCYQRLVNDDGVEGIYETVVHRKFTGNHAEGIQGYAKRELMNGYDDYPVEVTRLSEDSGRLYNTRSLPMLLRGIQMQIKIEMDSRIDRSSRSTLPETMIPANMAVPERGPGRIIRFLRSPDEVKYAETPPSTNDSIEIQAMLDQLANEIVGLNTENPYSQFRSKFIIDKAMEHLAKVLKLCFKNFQRFGPDEKFFKVTGIADPMVMTKGDPNEDYDIIIGAGSVLDDPDVVEKKFAQMDQLVMYDRNGKINIDKYIEIRANYIDPMMADSILLEGQEAQERVKENVTNDLAKIYAGIEVPARPNGGSIAIDAINRYESQPDIQQRISNDELFAERLDKYKSQYIFQIQQMQNAETGRIGTAPANVGGMKTQELSY